MDKVKLKFNNLRYRNFFSFQPFDYFLPVKVYNWNQLLLRSENGYYSFGMDKSFKVPSAMRNLSGHNKYLPVRELP